MVIDKVVQHYDVSKLDLIAWKSQEDGRILVETMSALAADLAAGCGTSASWPAKTKGSTSRTTHNLISDDNSIMTFF